jgi:putative spermidine/putrescine transport system ATP-binding protein
VDATVEVVEYQGREFAVEARTRDGLRLHVRTGARVVPGDAVTLTIAPERLLVFPRGAETPPEPVVLVPGAAVPAGEGRAELSDVGQS